MKYSISCLTCMLIVAWSGISQAEIYQSKDAEGNPVFTDTPTEGAQKVDLPQENIADAVEGAPEAKSTDASGGDSAADASATPGNVVVITNSRNEQLERERAADRPHEVLEAAKRHEVGDNPSPEELQRREAAKEGVYIDEKGNTVRVHHRGHAR